MHTARVCVPVLLLLTIAPRIDSQQASVTVVRDARAINILYESIAALGGTGSFSSANGVIAHGTLTASPGGLSGPVVWENAGAEFRYERPGANGPIVFVSGHGNPAIMDGSTIRRNIGHLAMTILVPDTPAAKLASYSNNPLVAISAPQQVSLNNSPALKISTVDMSDELSSIICKQDWYFDSNTLLPLRVDFLTSEMQNAFNTATLTYWFSDYRNVSGVLIPFSNRYLIRRPAHRELDAEFGPNRRLRLSI